MTEKEKYEKATSNQEDWAILPFDEEEDDARWTKLIEETEKLEKEAVEAEAVVGEILMESSLSGINQKEEPTEDTLF